MLEVTKQRPINNAYVQIHELANCHAEPSPFWHQGFWYSHQTPRGGGGQKGAPSILRTTIAANLKPSEVLGVSFKVLKISS